MRCLKNIKDVNALIWELDNHQPLHAFKIEIDHIQIPLWVLIRHTLLLRLAEEVGFKQPQSPKLKTSWLKKISFLINAIQFRPRLNKADVLMLSPSIGNIHVGGKVENIFHDAFANALAAKKLRVIILEQPNQLFECFKPHITNLLAFSLAWLYIKRQLRSIFFSSQCKKYEPYASEFINALQASLRDFRLNDEFFITIKKSLFSTLRLASPTIQMWTHVINKIQPRYVFMQDICCGGSAAIASLVFKSNAIIVIEDQHGIIEADDAQFNHGEFFKNDPEMCAFLPNYFLMYGTEWKNNLNIATIKKVVGNPYHSTRADKYKSNQIDFDFLIVTDSERPVFTLEKAHHLLNAGYRLLFRPHPRELSSAASRYGTILDHANLLLDTDRDVYKSISRVCAVVCIVGSYVSTVAYDALSLGKQIYCWCDRLSAVGGNIKCEGMQFFENDQMLMDALKIPRKQAFNLESLYEKDWQKNFHAFIEELSPKGIL